MCANTSTLCSNHNYFTAPGFFNLPQTERSEVEIALPGTFVFQTVNVTRNKPRMP